MWSAAVSTWQPSGAVRNWRCFSELFVVVTFRLGEVMVGRSGLGSGGVEVILQVTFLFCLSKSTDALRPFVAMAAAKTRRLRKKKGEKKRREESRTKGSFRQTHT